MSPQPRPLPVPATDLLASVSASPRLVAHLTLVHDVAIQLLDRLARDYPRLAVDREAALFGAATHDIGKTIHPEELSGPGSAHEHAGYVLLLDLGVSEELARFARTHGDWQPDLTVEELLVSLADKIWKGKREVSLEQLVVQRLTAAGGQPPWQAFMTLDDTLESIAQDADDRLAFQARHPIA